MALLGQFKTAFGTIRVTRGHDGGLAYYQNGSFHSQADKNGVSVCAYIHAIHEITRQAHARRVLIIGCGGGTLAIMLHRLGCKVTIIDINPAAFDIARRYFRLPDGVECICRDGIAYVQTTRKRYDAIVIDVFGSHNTVPPPFTTRPFFRSVAKALVRGGNMIMNVMTSDDRDRRADLIAWKAEGAGLKPVLFDWPGEEDRNTLIVGGARHTWRIPSGKEPSWMKEDMEGIKRRPPKKQPR